MLKRTSADVLKSRAMTLRIATPVGYFGSIIRNSIFRVVNTLIKVYSFIVTNFISKN